MRRGDRVTLDLQDDPGKPRPALIIQSGLYGTHPSVAILPVTGEFRNALLFRIQVNPTELNGQTKP